MKERKPRDWVDIEKRLQDAIAEGKSQTQFLDKEGIPYGSYYNWKRKQNDGKVRTKRTPKVITMHVQHESKKQPFIYASGDPDDVKAFISSIAKIYGADT